MFIRSAAELDGGEWACRAVWISQQLLHWDANRHHSNRIRVRLIKHCPQTLDGFSCCKGGIQGVNRLMKNIFRAFQFARQNMKKNTKVFSGTHKLYICIQLMYWKRALLLCFQTICTVNTSKRFQAIWIQSVWLKSASLLNGPDLGVTNHGWGDLFCAPHFICAHGSFSCEVKAQSVWSNQRASLICLSQHWTQGIVKDVRGGMVTHDRPTTSLREKNREIVLHSM